MQNARLDETQAGIKIAWRNINSFRYSGDTTRMAQREVELKSLLMRVKEESEKAGLKLNFPKTKIMLSGPITNRRGKNRSSDRFSFLGLQNHHGWSLQP